MKVSLLVTALLALGAEPSQIRLPLTLKRADSEGLIRDSCNGASSTLRRVVVDREFLTKNFNNQLPES